MTQMCNSLASSFVQLVSQYPKCISIRPYQVQVGRVEPRPDVVLDDDGCGGPRGEGADEGEEVPGGARVAAPLEAQPGEYADEEAQEHRVRQRVEERLLKDGNPM